MILRPSRPVSPLSYFSPSKSASKSLLGLSPRRADLLAILWSSPSDPAAASTRGSPGLSSTTIISTDGDSAGTGDETAIATSASERRTNNDEAMVLVGFQKLLRVCRDAPKCLYLLLCFPIVMQGEPSTHVLYKSPDADVLTDIP